MTEYISNPPEGGVSEEAADNNQEITRRMEFTSSYLGLMTFLTTQLRKSDPVRGLLPTQPGAGYDTGPLEVQIAYFETTLSQEQREEYAKLRKTAASGDLASLHYLATTVLIEHSGPGMFFEPLLGVEAAMEREGPAAYLQKNWSYVRMVFAQATPLLNRDPTATNAIQVYKEAEAVYINNPTEGNRLRAYTAFKQMIWKGSTVGKRLMEEENMRRQEKRDAMEREKGTTDAQGHNYVEDDVAERTGAIISGESLVSELHGYSVIELFNNFINAQGDERDRARILFDAALLTILQNDIIPNTLGQENPLTFSPEDIAKLLEIVGKLTVQANEGNNKLLVLVNTRYEEAYNLFLEWAKRKGTDAEQNIEFDDDIFNVFYNWFHPSALSDRPIFISKDMLTMVEQASHASQASLTNEEVSGTGLLPTETAPEQPKKLSPKAALKLANAQAEKRKAEKDAKKNK